MPSENTQKYSGFSLGLTVFSAGACMMCVQMAGGQTIAPYFGSNVFVWGSVISVFMAGLSLGYVLGGVVADRKPSPLVLSLLLILAGISVILIPFFTAPINEALIGLNFSSTYRPLLPLISVMSLYFLPSILLGMISPIAVRIASSALATVGRSVGRLYAINALGSVTGTLVGTFVLVLLLGNRAILITSGGILVLVGVINYILQRKLFVASQKESVSTTEKAPAVPGLRPLVFTCGMMFMGLQILSGAQIAPFFGSSVFVWGSIITVFLTAMTIGYRLGGKIADKYPTLPALSRIVASAGVLTLLVPIITPAVCNSILSMPIGGGLNVLQPLIASFILYFAPTVLFAMVAPYAVRISTNEVAKVGGVAGKLYALSTFGNLVGVLLTTFVLITAFGKTHLFEMAGLITVVVSTTAAIVNCRSAKSLFPKTLLPALCALAVVLAIVPKPELVSITGHGETVVGTVDGWMLIQSRNDTDFFYKRRILAQRESPYHHTAVIEQKAVSLGSKITTDNGRAVIPQNTVGDSGNRRDLRFDQYIQSSVLLETGTDEIKKPYTSGTTYSDMLHLPFLFNRKINDVLIIGGGGGVVPMIFRNSYDANIDVVEIDPIVVETAEKWFGFEPGQKLHVFVQDGRMFAHNSTKQYDLIILDAYTAGGRIPVHLTTREFFEVIKSRLKPDGVVLMNVISALEGKKGKLFRAEYKTFSEVFGKDNLYVCPKYLSMRTTELPINIMLMATGSAYKERIKYGELINRAQTLLDSKTVQIPSLLSHTKNMLNDVEIENIVVSDVPVLTDDYAPVDFMTSEFNE